MNIMHPHRRRITSSRHQTVIALSIPPFVRLGCCIVVIIITTFAWITWTDTSTSLNKHGEGPSSASRLVGLRQRLVKDDNSMSNGGLVNAPQRDSSHRLAIIIPFIGQGPTSIPSYLELFCTCAAGSASLVDFLLIHDGVLDGFHQSITSPCPENVRFISLGDIVGFSRALVKVTDRTPEEDFPSEVGGSRDSLARVLAKHIVKYPYVMVEFKPALGHIFQEYLDGYTHWGYSDLDIVFGDLARWISQDELDEFDIVTYGFGDQERIYLRGQFTFHKNDQQKVNQLWRRCEYLSKMEERFAGVLSGKTHLRFESAEGCYSEAVLEHSDIKIKYAVKAFTDVHSEDTAYTHGLYVSTGKRKDRTVIYKAGNDNPAGLANIPDNWFEERGSLYANKKNLLHKPVGKRQRIPIVEKKDAHCMYWAQKQYQKRLCLDDVESTDTIYWIDGQLYKEKYELATFPGGISSAPFFHFQEWKRYYRDTQLSGFHRKGPSSTFLLAKEGILPVFPPRITGSSSSSSNIVVKAKDKSIVVPSPLGQPMEHWALQHDDRSQLPHRYYCLQSEAGDNPNLPVAECTFLTSWRDSGTVEILSSAPGWHQLDVSAEVTLALTLQVHADQVGDSDAIEGFLNLLTLYLDRWQGRPCVLVLHVAGATPELAAKLRTKLSHGSDLSYFGLDNTVVGAIFTQDSDIFSRKALMNMAIDAAPTRWVVSGYELERGIILSQDTVYLVHRTAQVHKDFPGAVYIIPQFGLVEGDHDFSVGALELARMDGNLKTLAALEKGECEGDDETPEADDKSLISHVENLWWEMTRRLTQESPVPIDEKVVEQTAATLDTIQMGLTSLLMEKHQYNLYSSDISPILFFDNLGPRNGVLTNEMVREVDEFGGKLCYNSLRLAQMATLGYHINVLAGAFATSTPVTRAVIGDPSRGAPGVSRCDGCFFFSDEEDEDVLENISLDERMQPVKLAILWEHSANPLRGHT
ncbi:MAG: hypothetical protein SGILL_000725 [Bacillariaceae sp.]